MTPQTLHKRVVVLTGASHGIGRATAVRLASLGVELTLAARRADALAQLAAELHLQKVDAMCVPTDVRKEEDVHRLTNLALESFGRIDIWINNAGVGAFGPFDKLLMADHLQVLATNLIGTLHGSYHAFKQFVAQGHGTLINVASDLGQSAAAGYASYTAAKHGVVGLDDALRLELEQARRRDIHVCTVLPNATDAPLFAASTPSRAHGPSIQRRHDPERVVDAIVGLAMDPTNAAVAADSDTVEVIVRGRAATATASVGARRSAVAALGEPS